MMFSQPYRSTIYFFGCWFYEQIYFLIKEVDTTVNFFKFLNNYVKFYPSICEETVIY